jgi:hypothetical protein
MLPNRSMVVHHAAAVPGHVTLLRLVSGMESPVTPWLRRYSRVRALGARPDPLTACTDLLAAS